MKRADILIIFCINYLIMNRIGKSLRLRTLLAISGSAFTILFYKGIGRRGRRAMTKIILKWSNALQRFQNQLADVINEFKLLKEEMK
jgi:hypothetical protein